MLLNYLLSTGSRLCYIIGWWSYIGGVSYRHCRNEDMRTGWVASWDADIVMKQIEVRK